MSMASLPADRRAAVEQWLGDAMPRMPRASPHGARRPTRSARATARSRASRSGRASISTSSRARAAGGRGLRRRPPCWRLLVGGTAGWFGRGAWDGAGPGARGDDRGVRGAPALHRRGAPSDRGEGRREPSQSLALAPHRLRNADAQSRAFGLKLLGGRLLPGNAGRPAALYMYEGPTGERFTIYSRKRSGAANRRCVTARRDRSARSSGSRTRRRSWSAAPRIARGCRRSPRQSTSRWRIGSRREFAAAAVFGRARRRGSSSGTSTRALSRSPCADRSASARATFSSALRDRHPCRPAG